VLSVDTCSLPSSLFPLPLYREVTMMFGVIFKLSGIAIGCVLIVYMAAYSFRNARRLDARIRRFKEEQEEMERQGRTLDPYRAMAEIYAERQEYPAKKANRTEGQARRYAKAERRKKG
jgi:hypothetical protein